MKILASIAIASAALCATIPARAERCPAMAGADPALETKDAEARLDAIRDVMKHQATRARTWTIAWSAIGLGLSAESWVEVGFVDRDKRLPQVLVSIAPLYIPAQLALFPLAVPHDDDVLEAHLAETTTSLGPMAPCLRLERAEELFVHAADDEHWHDSLAQHVALWVLSGAYTAFLAIAFHDPRYTIIDGAGSFLVGELQMITQPNGGVDALEKYKRGDLDGARKSAGLGASWGIAPLGVGPGVAIVARF